MDECDMDESEAIKVSGLVRVLISDQRICERLRQRPAWVRGLYAQLVRLKDPFPSDVEIRPCSEMSEAPLNTIPLLPREARIATTPLHVAGMEVTIQEDGTATYSTGSNLAPEAPADVARGGFGLIREYPVTPGHVAFVVFVPPDASAHEWKELMAKRWADIQRVRELQRRGWREAQLAKTREFLADARGEMQEASATYREWLLKEGIPSLEARLAALENDAVDRHVRIDRPFRELVWLRAFVGAEKSPGDIAADWEDQLSAWSAATARRVPSKQDLLLTAAYEEWRKRRKALSGVDESTVRRSLRRWIGDLDAPLLAPRRPLTAAQRAAVDEARARALRGDW